MANTPDSEPGGGGDPFSRAYASIREKLVRGETAPGDQIVVTEAAKRLAISPTPVREALARLAGEGIVEDRRHHGFFAPLLSQFDLLELYDLCELYVSAAVREASRAARSVEMVMPANAEAHVPGGVSDPRQPLVALLRLSQNLRLVEQGERVIDCLAAALRAEAAQYGVAEPQPGRVDMDSSRHVLSEVRRRFRAHRRRAGTVAHAMAAAHRAKNRANMV